ncbi:hypothetical protein IJ579_03460 [bacterium]|nr:hypothetical protein [bacterium]
MKKIFLIFGFLFAASLAGYAEGNYLHTITLEKNNSGYNVILESDAMAKVTKSTPSSSELVLELSGITSADTVNALYKGTSNIDNLVIENIAHNKLKITVSADNIADSSIIMSPSDGYSSIVAEGFPMEKALWVMFVLALFTVIFRICAKNSEEDSKILIKQDIKDREIEMYRRYRRDLDSLSMRSVKDIRMKNMLKKIDRKIDERLMSSIK